jgi:hypothetical protein
VSDAEPRDARGDGRFHEHRVAHVERAGQDGMRIRGRCLSVDREPAAAEVAVSEERVQQRSGIVGRQAEMVAAGLPLDGQHARPARAAGGGGDARLKGARGPSRRPRGLPCP